MKVNNLKSFLVENVVFPNKKRKENDFSWTIRENCVLRVFRTVVDPSPPPQLTAQQSPAKPSPSFSLTPTHFSFYLINI